MLQEGAKSAAGGRFHPDLWG